MRRSNAAVGWASPAKPVVGLHTVYVALLVSALVTWQPAPGVTAANADRPVFSASEGKQVADVPQERVAAAEAMLNALSERRVIQNWLYDASDAVALMLQGQSHLSGDEQARVMEQEIQPALDATIERLLRSIALLWAEQLTTSELSHLSYLFRKTLELRQQEQHRPPPWSKADVWDDPAIKDDQAVVRFRAALPIVSGMSEVIGWSMIDQTTAPLLKPYIGSDHKLTRVR